MFSCEFYLTIFYTVFIRRWLHKRYFAKKLQGGPSLQSVRSNIRVVDRGGMWWNFQESANELCVASIPKNSPCGSIGRFCDERKFYLFVSGPEFAVVITFMPQSRVCASFQWKKEEACCCGFCDYLFLGFASGVESSWVFLPIWSQVTKRGFPSGVKTSSFSSRCRIRHFDSKLKLGFLQLGAW